MFQNIQEENLNHTKEETKKTKNILTNIMSKKYLLLYIISFMVSTIKMGGQVSPFSFAIIVATISNEIPIVALLVLGLIGNIIGNGAESILTYLLTFLVFFASFFVAEPRYNDESRNEKIKLGKRIFTSSLIIGIIKICISGFMIYDLLVTIANSILILVLYKVFVNSISVLVNFTEKRAFTLEEVIGTSLMLVVAACSLGNFAILGFSVRNIISIFIVLVLGWKNGMLIGTTAGVTIGTALGIITGAEPVIIAVYAISGLISGILNKFGKIGVILGFILGNIILTYMHNGGLVNIIMYQEILIAGIGLLAVPKNIKLDIENIIGNTKFLPVGANRRLDRSKQTAEKLKDVSKIVDEMARNYGNTGNHTEKIDFRERNKKEFVSELLNAIENLEDNILYENISNVESNIVDNIFNILIDKQFITDKELLEVFAKNDIYVVGFEEDEKSVNRDIEKMTNVINSAYRISKMSFIWNEKLKEEKSNVKVQLEGVSKVISDLADDIKQDIKSESNYSDEKDKIILLLKQKEILVQDIEIYKNSDGRTSIQIYIEKTNQETTDETIKNIAEKVLNEKLEIIEENEFEKEKTEKVLLASQDKFNLEIGQAMAIKENMPVSGDSMLKLKLKDGKYLIAISDGMGSGAEARKSSQIVIKMLQRLLNSGFSKETSIDLINSNLLNVSEDIFATLDIAIIDLYNGKIELIKSGSAPTYIKNKKKIGIIKSSSLPAGTFKNIKQDITEKDIKDGDLIIICSDGVIDSNVQYKNKELWLKYLLEDMESKDAQKIADIILRESIDNDYGRIKDDMSIFVCKISKK